MAKSAGQVNGNRRRIYMGTSKPAKMEAILLNPLRHSPTAADRFPADWL